MIRVDFVYRLKTQDLPEMMKKFEQSKDPKFRSEPSNVKMEMGFREEGEETFISLNIYYLSLEDYQKRTTFERSQQEWLDIWFKSNDFFVQESCVAFELN